MEKSNSKLRKTFKNFKKLLIFFSLVFILPPFCFKVFKSESKILDLSLLSKKELERITFKASQSGIVFDPWLNGFPYRRAIGVTNSGSTLSNYQVLVTLDTSSLISAGKMRSDCGDIRFTDSDGITQLNHWIESGCNSSSTKIWTKIPSIPTGTKTIYLYYGNPNASSTSNSSGVFGKSVSMVYGRDNYYIALILSNREWMTGGTNLGISGDDSGASRTLPSSRVVYGTSISTVYLNTNGLLRWDNVNDNRYSNYLDTANKILTPHWDDLYVSTSDRSDAGVYEITGSNVLGNYIGYRWATTYYSSRSTLADFEILLYDTRSIQFNVYRVWTSATPNEFISRGDSSNYVDLTSRWQNMESILFVPRSSPEPTTTVGAEDILITQAGSPASWSWKIPGQGEKIRSGGVASWIWQTFTNDGTSLTLPRGSATNWTWGP